MRIGIIGAMNEEIIELKSVMNNIEEEKVGNLVFYKGILEGKDVVLVEGGIGKVNAAICVTILIQHFKVDKVLFTGVAGGVDPRIDIGDIVIGDDLVEHDVDSTAFGYELGQLPRMKEFKFKTDRELFNLAYETAVEEFGKDRVWKGRIASGDQFVASVEKIKWLKDTFDAYCTEMEGAAVAHVCYVLNIPFLVIRAISDKANHDAKVDYPEFVKVAAKNSKTIIEGILKKM
ncbi:5'-methylthioadenosine/S-adenosylhomocysteine nucleosidase [Fusobacterium sp. DD29]|uniref:5'-methylthioadenosine/adenosylhomocysteine nucleosidase n=1 Tax=unclassified Fusobacterium TaxID=2648384 RepID=UPI001B8B5C3E|nr:MULTISPECIES: 5'-methylthioadenosine/adenosylhomocysteine nucleosidase [unclassified Fusobacterium]MBR8702019.1 5'-methylthioadenosine/S-adenosylhomocysteine nucleosidase [Fusobacterium sp. DD45]MBR8711820.1 5'-methylthioadenosine/S-adenosylhomocysteine nucleosidase [Fusobacterium sp. DD28]MBR8750241.1 5'-methylthioadenosine/S-adenosylhomocysteine nucleosidase [Fusobacterium sp. DD29]MBR8752382.1 5'-methylthioadenosine/S-adenosylhomocysteine nucleosidase [Fusobacterium sp. DD26]MBR8762474.1